MRCNEMSVRVYRTEHWKLTSLLALSRNEYCTAYCQRGKINHGRYEFKVGKRTDNQPLPKSRRVLQAGQTQYRIYTLGMSVLRDIFGSIDAIVDSISCHSNSKHTLVDHYTASVSPDSPLPDSPSKALWSSLRVLLPNRFK